MKKKLSKKKPVKVGIEDVRRIKSKVAAAWDIIDAAESELAELYGVDLSDYDLRAELITDFIVGGTPETVEEFVEEMNQIK